MYCLGNGIKVFISRVKAMQICTFYRLTFFALHLPLYFVKIRGGLMYFEVLNDALRGHFVAD